MSRRKRTRKRVPVASVPRRAESIEPIGEASPAKWYKKPWAVMTALATALGFVLLNSSTILGNVRSLPGDVDKTAAQFQSWLYSDDDWTGNWSASPEGYVDIEDLDLADSDLKFTLWVNRGEIDGTIGTKAICRAFPSWNYILLRGRVNANGETADVEAWDVLQGSQRKIASLFLERNGILLTVRPIAGRTEWFPKSATIAKHPGEIGVEPEPDQEMCAEERRTFEAQIKTELDRQRVKLREKQE